MSSIASTDSRHSSILPGWSSLPPEYGIPERAPALAEAQTYCRRLAQSHYENFSVASWFLPKRLRQHFFNLYAYCRISDDLGDEVGDASVSLRLLDEWEAELEACYRGQPRHPVFVALAESVQRLRYSSAAFCRFAYGFSAGSAGNPLRDLCRCNRLLPLFGESGGAVGALSLWLSGRRASGALRLHLHSFATG